MHGQVAPHSRSVWADLDAIVLQEVKALRSPPQRQTEVPFRSDEEFMDRAMAYLESRGEEAHLLVDRLRGMLGTAATDETDPIEAPQEPAGEAGIDDVSSPDVTPRDVVPPQAEHGQDT